MRRILQSPKHKRHNEYRARKALLARLRYRAWRTSQNRSSQHHRTKVKRKRAEADDPKIGYRRVLAPKVFSFIQEPERLSKFIGELKEHYDNRRQVFVVLRFVEILDYSALVVLLSIMVKFKAAKIPFNGDFPEDVTADRVLKDSGFFQQLGAKFEDAEKYELRAKRGDGIFTHSWKRVDAPLSARLIEGASMTVCGNPVRRQGVQRSLIELMMNTHNHADKQVKASKHWWVSVYHDQAARRVSFSFVDYGIGIFQSLDDKSISSKFYGWKQKILGKLAYKDNAEFLRLILEGKLHATVTGKSFRGKGLPGIRQVMARNAISNLHVITNDVFANVHKDQYRTMRYPFEGTFVYWEVGEENE